MTKNGFDKNNNFNAPRFSSLRIGRALIGSFVIALYSSTAICAPKRAEIVVDADTGKVLYEDQANQKRYPASITKVMTLYLLFDAIENGRITLDDRIEFSRRAAAQEPTKLGIKAGGSINVETAILSLVINSSNDTAVAVAEKLGGTESEFAKQMNQKAQEIGMQNTNFANASGLPNPNQVSTAEDLAKLAIAIRRDFPRQYHWFSRESFVFGNRTYKNHNHLVGKVAGVEGLKTGRTRAAGYNLAATAVRDGRHIVTVVLGGSHWSTRDARVTELIEAAYQQIGVSNQYANQNFGDENYYYNADTQALFVDNNYARPQAYGRVDLNTSFANNVDKNIFASKVIENKPIETSKANDSEDEEEIKPSNSVIQNGPITQNYAQLLAKSEPQPIIITPKPQMVKFEAPKPDLSFTIPAQNPPQETFVQATQQVVQITQVETPLRGAITENINSQNQFVETQNAQPNQTFQIAQNAVQIPSLPDFLGSNNLVSNNMVTQNSTPNNYTYNNYANNEITPVKIDFAQIAEDEAMRAEQERQDQIKMAALREKNRIAKLTQAKLDAQKAKASEEKRLAELKKLNSDKVERAKALEAEGKRQMALLQSRGNVVVQVGAFKEKSDAHSTMSQMAHLFPKFARGEVSTTKTSSGTWFRARFSGIAIEAAKKACASAIKSGAVCQIVSQ
jgi:D-alanyl-D-alanine carboxypeptidase